MTYKISVMYLVSICSITMVALRCTFTKCEKVIQEERHRAPTSVQVQQGMSMDIWAILKRDALELITVRDSVKSK